MNITVSNYFNMLTEAEYLLLAYFFAWFFPKREHFWVIMPLTSIAAIGLAFLCSFINVGDVVASGVINYLLLFLMGIGCLFASKKISLTSALFFGVIAYTFRHFAYLTWQLVYYLADYVNQGDIGDFSWISVVIALVVGLAFVPVGILIFKKIKEFPDVALPSRNILILSLSSLVIDNILNIIVVSKDVAPEDWYLKLIVNIFNQLSCVMILVIIFGLVAQTNLEKEVASINQMRHEEQKQYEMSKENIDLINLKCHDLKHQIRHFKEGSNGDVVNKDVLDSIEQSISIYDTRIKTGNTSLDVILQEKSLICKKNNIVFNCIIDGKTLNFMDENDIYSLFGNIVDNAIESVMALTNPDQRFITLKIRKQAGGVFAYEENCYSGSLSFKDGLPVSTKGDDRYHGFGMKSIRMIVNHYFGSMKITTDKQIFALSIFFAQPD
ncbi:MAG: GHKL domain-containing protein [Bacilli bacterium]|jgi:hypothetical protein